MYQHRPRKSDFGISDNATRKDNIKKVNNKDTGQIAKVPELVGNFDIHIQQKRFSGNKAHILFMCMFFSPNNIL